jgi:hypothetical protein
MAAKQVEVKGELSGLIRRVGKSGSESFSFNITGGDMQQWNRLLQFHREKVELTIIADQDELDLEGGKKNGKGGKEPKGAPADA